MLVSFVDRAEVLNDGHQTADGYLAFDAKVARVGVYEYMGAEIGRPELGVVKVYRPPESVFHTDAMRTFAHKPITDDHPSVEVKADNWRDHARGWTGAQVARDGDFLRVEMILADASVIDAYKAGKVELSPGYRAELTEKAGRLDDGTTYDFVMGPPRGNHIAVVDRARGGTSCRLGDSWPTGQDAPKQSGGRKVNTKTILVDGFQVEVTDAAEAAINKLTANLKAVTDAKTVSDNKVGELTAQVADLTAKLNDAAVTPEKLNALVASRAKVLADAKTIAPSVTFADTATEAEIRRLAVAARLGDAAAALNDEAVTGAFAFAVSQAASGAGGSHGLTDAFNPTVTDGAGGGQVTNLADLKAKHEKALRDRAASYNAPRDAAAK